MKILPLVVVPRLQPLCALESLCMTDKCIYGDERRQGIYGDDRVNMTMKEVFYRRQCFRCFTHEVRFQTRIVGAHKIPMPQAVVVASS